MNYCVYPAHLTALVLILLISTLTGCSSDHAKMTFRGDGNLPPALSRQIDALTLEGVDPLLTAELKRELIRQLSQTGMGKAASAPPTGVENTIEDLTGVADGAGGADLHWKYRNVGDYDQNSEVNVADLTPIGRNFNATPAVPDWLDAALADGDENGEVNVSDITPIGRNFNHLVAAYRVYASPDPGDYPAAHDAPNGPGAVLVGTVDLANAFQPDEGGKEFNFNNPEHTPGTGYWVRPIDNTEAEGSPSNLAYVATLTLEIDPGGAHQPDGGSGTALDPFELQPATSYDLLLTHVPDGEVTDDPGTTYTVSDPAKASVSAIGILNVDAGAAGAFDVYATYDSTDSQTLYCVIPENEPPVADLVATPPVTQRNVPVTFNAQGSSDPDGTIENYEWDFDEDGVFNEPGDESAVEGSGTIQRQWPDAGTYSTRVQVTDNRGATDNTSVSVTVESEFKITVDSEGSVGQQSSLAIVNGLPAIAYSDFTNNRVNYAWAVNAAATSWNITPATADDGASPRSRPSLVVVDGRPAIAYYDGGLSYVRANDASGSTWGSPVNINSAIRAGENGVSMCIVDGNPAICHVLDSGPLAFARAEDSEGISWGTPITIDPQGGNNDCSMKIVDGNPAVAYYNGQLSILDLYFIRATDTAGITWGSRVSVQTGGNVGQYPSLAVVDGLPAIAYNDSTNQRLMYIRANNATGSGWTSPVVLESESITHKGISLAVINGRPAVSYHVNVPSDLRFIWATNAEGTSWDSWIRIDTAGGSGIKPTSLVEFDGHPAISYYQDSAANLKFAVVY